MSDSREPAAPAAEHPGAALYQALLQDVYLLLVALINARALRCDALLRTLDAHVSAITEETGCSPRAVALQALRVAVAEGTAPAERPNLTVLAGGKAGASES